MAQMGQVTRTRWALLLHPRTDLGRTVSSPSRLLQRAENPLVDADSSRSGADQPNQDDYVHGFRQIQEIVEPVEKREPCRNHRKAHRGDGDDHLDDKRSAAQARKQPDDEQAAADELNRGDEISHEMRKRYPGTCKCFVHLTSAAGNEELVSSRNSEKDPERNAGEQDRKLLPRTASEQK